LTDLLIDFDQGLAQFLEVPELGDLLFGLIQGGPAGEGLGDGFTVCFGGELEMRAVPWVSGLSAVARRFATTAENNSDGPRTHVLELGDLTQQRSSR
jgi:hypothetical protein